MLQDQQACKVEVSNIANGANLILYISDPKGRELDRKMEPTKMTSNFDVKFSGTYQVCITNQAD